MEKEIIQTSVLLIDASILAIAVPITIGLTAVFRYLIGRDTILASRLAPLFSLLFGIFSYWLLSPDLTNYRLVIAGGIVAGLTGAGLYSGTQSVTEPTAVKLAKKRAVDSIR